MNHVNKKGFTLIELMLAMGFVSVLLIAIAMIVIQIGNIYNRGLTLKEVNQAGRSIVSELQRSINSSTPFDLSTRYKYNASGGRLCIGKYSYIWNYGKAIGDVNAYKNKYLNDDNTEIRFIKVLDTNASYCIDTSKAVVAGDAIEMLNVGQHNLAIHSFDIVSAAIDSKTGQQLYNISFVIGTNDKQALNTSASTCKPPSEVGSDINYCSINEFNITVRAGNGVGQ